MELNVLVVEERDMPVWEKARNYLKRKKIKLFSASTLREAYKILNREPINIVLSDFNLKNINSLNFLNKIKTIRPDVEIIFLSERVPLSKAIEAMKAGAYDFYEFPINMKLLMTVIEKAAEKQTLYIEKMKLEKKFKERVNYGNIIGRSKAMQYVIDIVASVASKNVNILLTGETGTGKEMIANAIHYSSSRSAKPYVKVNCAVFNEGILESELFGHEKGAFTGAAARRQGRFELANGGTIFLDEIADLPLGTQIKLLRILQEKEFERVGGNETIKVDVRVIAATNRDLKKLIDEGRFRDDLYYRLNVVKIELPALRERKEDFPLLASYFINKLNEEKGYKIKGISKEAMQTLLSYQWPGNVRELENALESAMALAKKDFIEASYLPAFLLMSEPEHSDYYRISHNLTLSEVERELIRLTLDKTNGNKTAAARALGIGLRSLHRKIKVIRAVPP
ncbi:sigma-54-dependent transcriptional regulator [Candidatus Magnetominusculus xianensis]|uniref:Acetoacetate metabolism regulatory protein n=1 Tax=Candidatus Magnetominusculus xianensis TaxID=1748249 RepID=A0ABR5SCQ1_9BACT|nr:sigma-54 dependent transcriptional regulator [Candidatus Magnetominusculus xianensis]KWT78135.1 acetoacetate metabolism regulatory protein [Candidatus Magnetominusculus xianensis]MBF0403971.1 sigma-54-dependent Fis family transcriptional regulator [Nitrospirota bacterium]